MLVPNNVQPKWMISLYGFILLFWILLLSEDRCWLVAVRFFVRLAGTQRACGGIVYNRRTEHLLLRMNFVFVCGWPTLFGMADARFRSTLTSSKNGWLSSAMRLMQNHRAYNSWLFFSLRTCTVYTYMNEWFKLMACFAICFSYRFWYIFVVVVVSSKSMRYLLFFFSNHFPPHTSLW